MVKTESNTNKSGQRVSSECWMFQLLQRTLLFCNSPLVYFYFYSWHVVLKWRKSDKISQLGTLQESTDSMFKAIDLLEMASSKFTRYLDDQSAAAKPRRTHDGKGEKYLRALKKACSFSWALGYMFFFHSHCEINRREGVHELASKRLLNQ